MTTQPTEAATEPAEGEQQQEKPAETFTQADVDRIVKERLKRDREKVGDVAALQAAATELAAIKESQKTEAQKTADRLAAAEQDAQKARSDALRYKVAAKYQITEEDAELFLTGDDEATLTKQADRLTTRTAEQKRQGNYSPREGNTPPSGESGNSAFARELFTGS